MAAAIDVHLAADEVVTWGGHGRRREPGAQLGRELPAQPTMSRGRRAPICLHMQDLWPDSVTGSHFVEGRALKAMERALQSVQSQGNWLGGQLSQLG